MKKVTEGQKLKLAVTLVENVSWDKLDGDFIQNLIGAPTETGKKGTEWLQNGAKLQIIVGTYIVDLDADPMIPVDGWRVESHTKGGRFKYDPTKVELYLDEGQKDGEHLEGNELREKLGGKNPFNANLLDFYLSHPELIPESWKEKAVFFWGTVYRSAGGSLYVRYLRWSGGRWDWNDRWLDDGWGSPNPAAVLCK